MMSYSPLMMFMVIKRERSWSRRIALPLLGREAKIVLNELIRCLGEKSFLQVIFLSSSEFSFEGSLRVMQ